MQGFHVERLLERAFLPAAFKLRFMHIPATRGPLAMRTASSCTASLTFSSASLSSAPESDESIARFPSSPAEKLTRHQNRLAPHRLQRAGRAAAQITACTEPATCTA
jgi:hypothetical protein